MDWVADVLDPVHAHREGPLHDRQPRSPAQAGDVRVGRVSPCPASTCSSFRARRSCASTARRSSSSRPGRSRPDGGVVFKRRKVTVRLDCEHDATGPGGSGLDAGETVAVSTRSCSWGCSRSHATIVGLALRFRGAVLLLAAALVVVGLFAFRQLPIEAYPNPVPPLVEVITQPDGWSAEEVERYVTVPLEIGLAGHAGARSHPLAVALRAVATSSATSSGAPTTRTRARRSSTASSSSSCPNGMQAAALAVERDRRGVPLHASTARATRSTT